MPSNKVSFVPERNKLTESKKILIEQYLEVTDKKINRIIKGIN